VVEAGKEGWFDWFEAARTTPTDEDLERVKKTVIEEGHISAVADGESWRQTFEMFTGMTIENAFETALTPGREGKKKMRFTQSS
jgi:hypothetical protein